ncbi:ATP-dependent DNA helicase Q4-like, partial [Tropilaelaps mercedesae]
SVTVDAAINEATPNTKSDATNNVVSFEDEFAQEMRGRSDVANVRRLKTHHRFNTQIRRDTQAPKTSTTEPFIDEYDCLAEIEQEVRRGRRKRPKSKPDDEEGDGSDKEQSTAQFVRANSPEKPTGTPAPRSILDPFLWQEQEREELSSQPMQQLYP